MDETEIFESNRSFYPRCNFLLQCFSSPLYLVLASQKCKLGFESPPCRLTLTKLFYSNLCLSPKWTWTALKTRWLCNLLHMTFPHLSSMFVTYTRRPIFEWNHLNRLISFGCVETRPFEIPYLHNVCIWRHNLQSYPWNLHGDSQLLYCEHILTVHLQGHVAQEDWDYPGQRVRKLEKTPIYIKSEPVQLGYYLDVDVE